MEEQVEVPPYFVCPISLQMMCDPVTLPTGITYDRDGIERWLLAAGTCPLTKQPVPADSEPTPNHTLRRLIQSWCADHGVDLVPTPKPPADRARLADLVSRLNAAATGGAGLLDALIELRDVACERDRNRKLLAAVPGAVDVLAAVVVASCRDATAACDEALGIVSSLQLPEQCVSRLAGVERSDGLVDALVATLQRSNTTSRAHAAAFLEAVTASMAPSRLASLPDQVFDEMTRLLRDRVATRSALYVLVGATPWGRNRVKAVDAGAVDALVDMLLDDGTPDRRVCELVLSALDRMCGCAEGRAALVSHGAGVAVVGRSVMRVSEVASDRAVRVLRSVARHAATAAVVQEMAQTGVVGKLCVVASSEQRCGERTRERARETLRLHARAWRNSPCLQPHLQALYPSPSC